MRGGSGRIEERQLRTFVISLAAISLACTVVYPQRTRPLDTPLARSLHEPRRFSELPKGELSATIGDELFVIRRFKSGAKEVVSVTAPAGLQPLPLGGTWRKTHNFTDDDGVDFSVWTSSAWYGGDLGAILDSDGRLATSKPFVQVGGAKRGRRWESSHRGQEFFSIPVEVIETWGLRFGGRRGKEFAFDIFERANPTVTTVAQSILVEESDFLTGFIVRGVRVRGVGVEGSGEIRFELYDTRSSSHD